MATPKIEMLLVGASKTERPDTGIIKDINCMLNFATLHSIKVRNVLVNFDAAGGTFSGNPPASNFHGRRRQFRNTFRDFLQDSAADFLILYYSGEGDARWDSSRNCSKEYLKLSEMRLNWYYDTQLTDDIDNALPEGKTLYLVIDSSRAGGVINLWELDCRLECNVILFAGSNAELSVEENQRTVSKFTATFCSSAEPGKALYSIAEDILGATKDDRYSPAVRYGQPKLCVATFGQ